MTFYGDQAAFISAGGYHHHIGLNTWHSKGAPPAGRGGVALYHTAIRYPTRKDLAIIFDRLRKAHYPLSGASDHGVSEALYLNDPDNNGVELYWDRPRESWQLKTNTAMNAYDYLAKIKGLTREESVQMHAHVTDVARAAGLSFHFDKTVVANSHNGHRLSQLAKTHALADVAEENLFKAHFTDGKNIDDVETLVQIGVGIGLAEEDVRKMLASSDFADEVKQDELRARSLGIRAVPFFTFNDRSAVSEAQASDVFLQALEKSWAEYEAAAAR
jgi:catechol 2,3-dioxygenase